MMRNPEVSVRSRGVMEKCTYCIQRIAHGRITAEKENRKCRDGEVITACQQACPAGAIAFGNLNDKSSRVTKIKEQPAQLSAAGRFEHASAHHVPGGGAEPESRT